MALLTVDERARRLKYLGFGEYNKTNIKKFQKHAFPNDPKQWDGKWGVNTDRAGRHFYNVKKVTKNFSPEEFKCTCGHCTGYPSYMKQVELKHIQKIRNHYGKAMKITSGLRCSYENKRVGGVRNSGHTRGYAVDFYMPGVTDTIANRKKALTYIKKLDNHEFTYGADMKDSNGTYRTAAGMGNAMHTETHAPIPTIGDRVVNAAKAQAKHMKNYKYSWRSNPTIANSKFFGTCVTFVACSLQRCDILPSGHFIWHDRRGKITHANSKLKVIYTNKKLKDLKKVIRKGDIIEAGDKTDVGAGSHIFIFNGTWKGDDPYIWDNHSAEIVKKTEKDKKPKTGLHSYSGNKKAFIIARPK